MAEQNNNQGNNNLKFIKSLNDFNDFVNYCVEQSKGKPEKQKLSDLVKGYEQEKNKKLKDHWQVLVTQKDKIQNVNNPQVDDGEKFAADFVDAVASLSAENQENLEEDQNDKAKQAKNNLEKLKYGVQELLNCQLIINKAMSEELNKVLVEEGRADKKIKSTIDQMGNVLKNNNPVKLDEVKEENKEENNNNNQNVPQPPQDDLAKTKSELAKNLDTCLKNIHDQQQQQQQKAEFIKQFTAFNKLMNHCASKFGDKENNISPHVEKSLDYLAKNNNLSNEEKTAVSSFIKNYGNSIKEKARQNMLPNLEPRDVDHLLGDLNLLLSGKNENRSYPPTYNREKLLNCQALINSSVPKNVIELLDVKKDPDKKIKNSIEQINDLVKNGKPIALKKEAEKGGEKEEEANEEEINNNNQNNVVNEEQNISEVINTCLTNVQNHVNKYGLIDSFNVFNEFMNEWAKNKEKRDKAKSLSDLIGDFGKTKLNSTFKCIQKTISQNEEENQLNDANSLLTELIKLTDSQGQQGQVEEEKYKLDGLVQAQWKINKALSKQVEDKNKELDEEINELTKQVNEYENNEGLDKNEQKEEQPQENADENIQERNQEQKNKNKEKPSKDKLVDKRAELSKKKIKLGNVLGLHLGNAEKHVSEIKKQKLTQEYKTTIDSFKSELNADEKNKKGLITLLKAIQEPLNKSNLKTVKSLQGNEKQDGSLANYILQIDNELNKTEPNFNAIGEYCQNVIGAFKNVELNEESDLGKSFTAFEKKYKIMIEKQANSTESLYYSKVDNIKKIKKEIDGLNSVNVDGDSGQYESYKKIRDNNKENEALKSQAKTMKQRMKDRIDKNSIEEGTLDLILSALSGENQEKKEEVSDMDLLLSAFEQYGKLEIKDKDDKEEKKDAKDNNGNKDIEQDINQIVMQNIIETSLNANYLNMFNKIFYKDTKNEDEDGEQVFDQEKINKTFDNLNKMSQTPEFQKALKNMMSDEKTVKLLNNKVNYWIKMTEGEKAKGTKAYKFKNWLKENYWNWDSESSWYKNLGKNVGKMALSAVGAVLTAWKFGALTALLAVNPIVWLWIGFIAIAGIVLMPIVKEAIIVLFKGIKMIGEGFLSGIKYIARHINKNWQWAQQTPEEKKVDEQKSRRETLHKCARPLDFMANFFNVDIKMLQQEGINFDKLENGQKVIEVKDENQKNFLETLLKLYEANEKYKSDRGYEHKEKSHEINPNKVDNNPKEQNNNQDINQNNNIIIENNNDNNAENANIQNPNEQNNNVHNYQDNGSGIKPLKMLKDYLKEIQSKHKIELKDIKVKVPKQKEKKKTK